MPLSLGGDLEVITYLRKKKPPTLEQFLIRKQVGELMKGRHDKGFVPAPDGRPVPKLAAELKEQMKGVSAKSIKASRPEWVEEWRKKYSK